MYKASNSGSTSIGFCGLLAVVFITLKLIGIIAWSWWWVLAPLWIPALISVSIVAIFLVVIGFVAIFSK